MLRSHSAVACAAATPRATALSGGLNQVEGSQSGLKPSSVLHLALSTFTCKDLLRWTAWTKPLDRFSTRAANISTTGKEQHRSRHRKMGDTKVMWALKTGDLDEVKAKLVTAEDANRTLEGGRKPLHYASDFGQTDVVEYLISIGADVNAPDKHGLTPLISACFEDHLSCVKVLLEKGADKDLKGPNEVTALEAAQSDPIRALLK